MPWRRLLAASALLELKTGRELFWQAGIFAVIHLVDRAEPAPHSCSNNFQLS